MKKITIALSLSLVATALSQLCFHLGWFSLAFLLNPLTLVQGALHPEDQLSFNTICWLSILNTLPFLFFGALFRFAQRRKGLQLTTYILLLVYVLCLVSLCIFLKSTG